MEYTILELVPTTVGTGAQFQFNTPTVSQSVTDTGRIIPF